ncbi:uncharacterized protein LOC131650623 [Vicia villosa]|uniref:uncharacterized protein LOC131650623 n=1 Tax=Vicia villosa TaxID=3911 RepID=UPI00273BDF71|nr:uncharacterized protein LOC131650623 [Vicia villosa]
MRKAIINGDFRGFKINEEENVNMLQFADDMVTLAEGDTTNLWSMKVILRGFEMMSGLRVNFNKSNIYGVNVCDGYLDATSTFLACKVDRPPFKFLGVKVGDSPRKLSMWKDFIVMLNEGWPFGREAPYKIIKEIRAIQSNFLWNGSELKRHIHWVSWDFVCKTREEGGLGVKNVEIMNVALLSKWDVSCKVGNGTAIPFRYELFVKAKNDSITVVDSGTVTHAGWLWNPADSFFDSSNSTEHLWHELLDSIQHVVHLENVPDEFSWSSTVEGVFTVNSCYRRFKAKLSGPPLNPCLVKAAAFLWKVKALPNFFFFGWRIFHNRVATKEPKKKKRGIMLDDGDYQCAFCSLEEECLQHLLGGCIIVSNMWRKVFKRIGPLDNLSLEEFEGFIWILEKMKSKAKRMIVAII